MTRSARSLLRQASIPLAVACAATGVVAGPAFAQGPAPEPAPPRTSSPKPEPAPGTTRGPARSTTTTREAPTRQAPIVVRSVQPAAPPPSPPPPPAPVVQLAPSPPPAPAPQAPARTQKPETVKVKPAKRATSEQPLAQALPRLRPTAVSEAASTDNMLLIGGLALFVLVLGDTVFLTLSARYLREI